MPQSICVYFKKTKRNTQKKKNGFDKNELLAQKLTTHTYTKKKMSGNATQQLIQTRITLFGDKFFDESWKCNESNRFR